MPDVIPCATAASIEQVTTSELPPAVSETKESLPVPSAMHATPLSHDFGVGSTTAPGIFQTMMSIAYDTAAINARRQELERREQDIERKERRQQDRDDKFLFMSQAAESFKHFLHSR